MCFRAEYAEHIHTGMVILAYPATGIYGQIGQKRTKKVYEELK